MWKISKADTMDLKNKTHHTKNSCTFQFMKREVTPQKRVKIMELPPPFILWMQGSSEYSDGVYVLGRLHESLLCKGDIL